MRNDIKIKQDLVEEIARLYGLENIPSTSFDLQNNANNKKKQGIIKESEINDIIRNNEK